MARDNTRLMKTETKRDRFVRLAESRTGNAMRAIRTIAKLGNKAQYEFDDGDIKKIAAALTKEVEAMKIRMGEPGSKNAVDFRL